MSENKQNEYEARKEQYTTRLAELQSAKKRLGEIYKLLPDADEKTRSELQAERNRLQVELSTGPDELGELARRMCLAHLAYLVEERERARAVLEQAQAAFDQVEAEVRDIKSQQDALGRDRLQYHQVGSFSPLRRQDQPIYDYSAQKAEIDAKLKALGEKMGPAKLKLRQAGNELGSARSAYNFPAGRAQSLYGVSLDTPHVWPRAAHEYGEQVKKVVKSELA